MTEWLSATLTADPWRPDRGDDHDQASPGARRDVSSTRVVVLGGGYAGTTAANHLRLRADVDVALVNPRPQFVERIRLHQLVADTHAATVGYDTLLGDGVRLVVDTAVRIDTAAREVVLASGDRLAYDHVIDTVGSTGAVPASVPGAAEHAHPIAELESAQRLREAVEALAEREPSAPLTVVGGGLASIETAAELAGRGHPVRLVCGVTLGLSLSGRGRRSVLRWLARHGVEVLESGIAVEVRAEAVVLDDATVLPSAATVWAAGFGVPELAATSGLATDPLGRLLTDETLTSVDDDRIVAAGDAAAPSGRPLRMSCQAAGPLGAQAANTVLSRIAGTEPALLDQAFVGSAVSLGRHGATIQVARRDDTPVDVVITGRVAAMIKEAICRGTLWGLRREARQPGSTVWLRVAGAVGAGGSSALRWRPGDHQRARRAVHPPAPAAVHHRLRDPRYGDRGRRRAAGQLPALGPGGPFRGAGHEVLPRAAGDPAGAQRTARRRPPSRGLHRPPIGVLP